MTDCPGLLLGAAVFFNSCGWAGWDLAAAHCAIQTDRNQP